MAKDSSFNIVSELDIQEVDNAVNMAAKEIANRFDFKGSKCRIEFDRQQGTLDILADDEFRLRSVVDVLMGKIIQRAISPKALDFKQPEEASGGTVRQHVQLIQGLDQDKAKEIVKSVKQSGLKAQVQIEGDRLRVSAKSRDVLQQVIAHVKSKDFGVPLQFINYR